jgi:hypothetical protein
MRDNLTARPSPTSRPSWHGSPPPAVDDELRGEIRDLVIARNHRRARRGEPALDVDAEVERQIAELGQT